MKVLYVRANFPKFSETFIVEEIVGLRRRGHEVRVVGAFGELERLHHKIFEERVFDFVEYDGRVVGAPIDFDAFVRSRSRNYVNRKFRAKIFFKNPLHLSRMEVLYDFVKNHVRLDAPRETLRKIKSVFRDARRVNNIWIALHQSRPRKAFIPDVIHCPFATIHNLVYARQISENNGGIPYTVSFRAKDLYAMYDPEPEIRRDLIATCSKVLTIAKFNRIALGERYPHLKDAPVVHSCIDATYFAPSREIAKTKGKIVAVGRLIEKKGFEYLIDACWNLKQTGRAFRCLIIGEGPLQDQLEARVRDRGLTDCVKIMGPLVQGEVKSHLNDAELFALPCITAEDRNRDILPNAIKEAMAMALPVVTFNSNGITELIEHTVDGLLVEPGSVLSLSNVMASLLDDESERVRLGGNARARILAEFHRDGETAKLEAQFCEATGLGAPGTFGLEEDISPSHMAPRPSSFPSGQASSLEV